VFSSQLFIKFTIGFDPRKIKTEVGKALKIPIIGLLKSNLPAFILKIIIKKDGTIILIIVLRAANHPTLYMYKIRINPTI
tara:strand:- start:904 stop:1143 length:240 start_codon:yes stop_codon:yes gene_type:complete